MIVEAYRNAMNHPVPKIDAHLLAARIAGGALPSGDDIGGAASHMALDLFKKRRENVLATEFEAGLDGERRRDVGEFRWKGPLRNVDTDAGDRLTPFHLDKNAAKLPLVEQQVVWPADVASQLRDPAKRQRRGEPERQREHRVRIHDD